MGLEPRDRTGSKRIQGDPFALIERYKGVFESPTVQVVSSCQFPSVFAWVALSTTEVDAAVLIVQDLSGDTTRFVDLVSVIVFGGKQCADFG